MERHKGTSPVDDGCNRPSSPFAAQLLRRWSPDSLWPRMTPTRQMDLSPFRWNPSWRRRGTEVTSGLCSESNWINSETGIRKKEWTKGRQQNIKRAKTQEEILEPRKVVLISVCFGKQCFINTYAIKRGLLMIKCLYVNACELLFNIFLTHATWKPCQPLSSTQPSQRPARTAGTCCPSPFGAWHYHINFVNDLVICTT